MGSVPIEINDQFREALRLMEEPEVPVFVTGKAGTGKSTLLSHFRKITQRQVAVLAPTGVAAVNIKGQTIHSFFHFRPDITPEGARKTALRILRQGEGGIYQKLHALLIDEVSMVRADLMDSVDQFLQTVRQRKGIPFGGLKLILIGDLYQLPPVVTSRERQVFEGFYPGPYFFHSRIFGEVSLKMVELEKIYRQRDQKFITLLNAVRNNTTSLEQLEELNLRHLPDFRPPESGRDLTITLTSTNDQASEINAACLNRIPGKSCRFEGSIEGDFDKGALPTDPLLDLKPGAQVMLVNNDSEGRWINGTMGTVHSLKGKKICVRLENGSLEEVTPYRWELFRYDFDPNKNRLVTETVGTFTQYPLKLAWAVTIHKSQGKTFERVVIDVGRGTFATGQMYVALSRCRSFEGMVLRKKLLPQHVRVDYRIVNFLTRFQYRLSEEKTPLSRKTEMIEEAIRDQRCLDVVYLKTNDEKSRRFIQPESLGEMEYAGKTFLGFRGFCLKRQEDRTFRVDRILELKVVDRPSLCA